MLSEHPREHIGRATRTKRDNELNRPAWLGLCRNRQSQKNWQ